MNATPSAPGNRVVRKIRIRAILFLAAAAVAGVAAVFLVKTYLDQARQHSRAAPLETVPVVVASLDLPIGQRVEAEQVAVARWPADFAPAGSFQRADEVVGQTLRQAVVKGEPLLGSRLATRAEGQGLAAILDPGARAMAVKVDQVVGIAGFVQPGDYVDVIATITPDDETRAALASQAAKMSKIILQNIKVLAVGEHMSTDGRKPVKVQVVTLEVSPEGSERLALASQHGSIQLTMRPPVDQEAVATGAVTPLALLAPDADAPKLAVKAAAESDRDDEARRRRHSRHRARREAKRPPPRKVEAAAPRPPVVEILRGTSKVEERKLRSPGGEG